MGIFDWFKKKEKSLSDEEYSGKIKNIKQKRNLAMQKAASKARRKERNVQINLRDLSRRVEEAAKVLGKLQQAAAQTNANLIKDSWRRGKAEIAEIEKIKVKVSAYAALIAKILDETADLKVPRNLRPQLKTYASSLLKETRVLEKNIAAITDNVRQVTDKTAGADPLWGNIVAAIKNASNSFSKILRDGEAGLAIEQRVREELGRA